MFFLNLWAILEFCNTFGLGLKGAYIYELGKIDRRRSDNQFFSTFEKSYQHFLIKDFQRY